MPKLKSFVSKNSDETAMNILSTSSLRGTQAWLPQVGETLSSYPPEARAEVPLLALQKQAQANR